jgi:hypothetical protein
MIHEILGGLSLVSMNARRTESAVGQLTTKLKNTFKKDSKVAPLSSRTRSSSYTSNYKYPQNNQSSNEDPGKNLAKEYMKHAVGSDSGKKPQKTDDYSKPTAQPNAKSVYPPPPPQQIQKQYVVALFDFEGSEEADLGFQTGDKIEIISKASSEWWNGRVNGREGNFPSNYVKEI